MSRFAIFLGLCAVAFAGAVRAASLTVVGFNVQSDGSSDLVIGRQLERSSDVDLWGLTEIYREGGWVESMRGAAGAGEGVEFGAIVGATGEGNENLILYRTGRLVLLGSEELTSVVEGKRDAAPLVARFRLDGETEFLFVLVRLSDWGPTRRDQTRRLAQWASAQTLPIVAAGTFAFEVPEGGTTGDEAMAALLAATDWQWVRPADAFATACGQARLVQDFVFAGGAARDWGGVAAVSFRQNNYCKDNDSDRSSSFRPVIAAFSTDGRTDGVAGVMPERQVGPFLPTTVSQGEVREAREEPSQPALVTEAGTAPPPVTEAGAGPVVPESPPPRPATAAPVYPSAPIAAPAAAPAPPPVPAETAPAAVDPEREALMKRLEALEREAREIREALEDEE